MEGAGRLAWARLLEPEPERLLTPERLLGRGLLFEAEAEDDRDRPEELPLAREDDRERLEALLDRDDERDDEARELEAFEPLEDRELDEAFELLPLSLFGVSAAANSAGSNSNAPSTAADRQDMRRLGAALTVWLTFHTRRLLSECPPVSPAPV